MLGDSWGLALTMCCHDHSYRSHMNWHRQLAGEAEEPSRRGGGRRGGGAPAGNALFRCRNSPSLSLSLSLTHTHTQVPEELLRERRTSFERRKWGKEAGQAEDADKPRRRWGPKQMINAPNDMRLKKMLLYQQRRGLLSGGTLSGGTLGGLTAATPRASSARAGSVLASGEESGFARDGFGGDPSDVMVDLSLKRQKIRVCRHADRHVPEWSQDMRMLLREANKEQSEGAKVERQHSKAEGGDERLLHDIPLSPLGQRQAHELAQFLATNEVLSLL